MLPDTYVSPNYQRFHRTMSNKNASFTIPSGPKSLTSIPIPTTSPGFAMPMLTQQYSLPQNQPSPHFANGGSSMIHNDAAMLHNGLTPYAANHNHMGTVISSPQAHIIPAAANPTAAAVSQTAAPNPSTAAVLQTSAPNPSTAAVSQTTASESPQPPHCLRNWPTSATQFIDFLKTKAATNLPKPDMNSALDNFIMQTTVAVLTTHNSQLHHEQQQHPPAQ